VDSSAFLIDTGLTNPDDQRNNTRPRLGPRTTLHPDNAALSRMRSQTKGPSILPAPEYHDVLQIVRGHAKATLVALSAAE
jgi:hypothetical protein